MNDQRGVAALPMYDLPETRSAVDELWLHISAELTDSLPELLWGEDADGTCHHPALVLGQTCGWPLATSLAGRVTVVGAFRYDLDGGSPNAEYRSVVIARDARPLATFAGTVGALNGWDSLSGWVSLAVALETHSGGRPFFDSVIETGSHVASLDAVRGGDADLASIDAVTFALLQRERPDAVSGLTIVGRGPLVPTLPLVTAAADPRRLRAAIAAALADPRSDDCCARLLIDGFVALDASAYAGLLPLAPTANKVIPPPSET